MLSSNSYFGNSTNFFFIKNKQVVPKDTSVKIFCATTEFYELFFIHYVTVSMILMKTYVII